MPAVIQLVPQGLLGFFGIKNGGQAPLDVEPRLSGSLDMRDWYFKGECEVFSIANNAPAVGFNGFSSLTVPTGEYWWVSDFSVTAVKAAAPDTITVQACAQVPTGATSAFLWDGPDAQAVAATSVNARITRSSPSAFWLQPGSVLGGMVHEFTGTGRFIINAEITRLPI